MRFDIPNRFQLGGITINVEKVKQITGEGNNCDGMAFYCKSKIELKDDESFTDDYKKWVFFHELVHHIFNTIEEPELRGNENLVGRVASALQQAIRTME